MAGNFREIKWVFGQMPYLIPNQNQSSILHSQWKSNNEGKWEIKLKNYYEKYLKFRPTLQNICLLLHHGGGIITEKNW